MAYRYSNVEYTELVRMLARCDDNAPYDSQTSLHLAVTMLAATQGAGGVALVSEEMLRVEGERVRSQGDNYWQTRHHAEITQIVLRHHALIRLTGDVERMFSLALLINFMNSSIIICFCGFCCVLIEEWNEVAYKSFLVTALTQTWLLCWYGQKLIDSSKRLADALYDCGWYNASKKARSAVLIMLHRAQKGIYVTTHGFSVISLASYSTIIKTAWSYFTLLLNFFKDKSANL